MAGQEKEQNTPSVLQKAAKRAFGGGVAGATAMVVQVGSLMWLRTTVNYQYRYGTSTSEALKTLYSQGGVRRFYRGVLPALMQGPLSRFGDTAANTGMLELMNNLEATKDLPVSAKTVSASAAAASWRVFLMPIDSWKTVMQVEGTNGMKVLKERVAKGGPRALYHGALAAMGATFVGHYPWFYTYNKLDEVLPPADADSRVQKFGRAALQGFCASAVSDTCSNSIRVAKVTKQASTEVITYPQAVKQVIEKDGLIGLFGRGLKTKILANGLQGMLFSIVWKEMKERMGVK